MTRDTPADANATKSSGSTDESGGSPTMGGIDHTHPHRNTTFGSIFGRGPSIAADGGEPAAAPETTDGDAAMADVDHDAPSETGANATFERGAEHADTAAEASDVADGEPTDE